MDEQFCDDCMNDLMQSILNFDSEKPTVHIRNFSKYVKVKQVYNQVIEMLNVCDMKHSVDVTESIDPFTNITYATIDIATDSFGIGSRHYTKFQEIVNNTDAFYCRHGHNGTAKLSFEIRDIFTKLE
jgi:hypothetical protein